MKRLQWFFIFIVVFTIPISSSLAQPKISVIGGTKFNLGTVDRGQVAQKKVTVKNIGTDTLILGNVEVSCGCTGTVVSNSRLGPGKSGEVQISFNSSGFSGEVHKSVTINSNSSDNPKTVVEFTALVVEEVLLEPRALYFRTSQMGKVDTFSITVRNGGKEDFQVTGYNATLAGLTLNVPKEPVHPNETVRISGEFNPKEAKNVITDNLIIQTSSKKQPEITIPVLGAVKEFQFK